MYGDIIIVAGLSYGVIMTPIEISRDLVPNGYQPDRAMEVRMLATDFNNAGLSNRKTFVKDGKTFEVVKYKIDAKEPTISFTAILRK